MTASRAEWNAQQYLKFEEERTRPSRDLLAQVPVERVRAAADLGCGPGNSTELLIHRFPDARVIGVDSSSNMLKQARERIPTCEFVNADLNVWEPDEPVDLLFANAVFQWMPDHRQVMKRLTGLLPPNGVLAAQMPDNTREPSHVLLEELAKREPWASNPAIAQAARADLGTPEFYYGLLKPICQRVEIWHTVYNHLMEGPEAIVEWFKGSALRPFVAALDASSGADFLAEYTAGIRRVYPPLFDGKLMLRFPRLFIVAVK